MAVLSFLVRTLFIIIICLSIILAIGIGIGRILILFLPFTWFEASVLSLIALLIFFYIAQPIIGNIFAPDAFFDDEYDEYDKIPPTRFHKTDTDKTWEAWVRYQLANDVYYRFQEFKESVAPLNDKQQQELAIRIADIVIAILKRKTEHSWNLEITTEGIQKYMEKAGQRPYDYDILSIATVAINENIDSRYEQLSLIINTQVWGQKCDMFDL